MKGKLIVLSATILGFATLVYGCRDSSTPVEADVGVVGRSADSSTSVGDSISVVRRGSPLAGDVSASQEIGPSGGTISLPDAGLTLEFSAGAVPAPTVITARMLAGNFVVFTCEPHGLVFNAPVKARLDLKALGTNKGQIVSGHFKIGYIMAPSAVDSAGHATALEQLPVDVQLVGRYASFQLPHFSTFALASGVTR